MSAKPTGAPRFRGGHWYARIFLGPKDRPSFLLAGIRESETEKAWAKAAVLVEIAEQLRASGHVSLARTMLDQAAAADGRALDTVRGLVGRIVAGDMITPRAVLRQTVRSFGEDWTSGRLHDQWPDHVRDKTTSHNDKQRLEDYVYPIIGSVPLAEVTLDHADAVMRAIDPELARSTRRHVAQAMHRLFAIAVYPARLIERNPLPKGFLPKAKSEKALTFLYPSEDAKLLACVQVPLEFRLLYGFLAREGMRTSEAAALTWDAVDLARGAVRLDENKTNDPRAWALGPSTARALRIWYAREGNPKGSAPVIEATTEGLARTLRRHLKLVKASDRAEIFETSDVRIPIRAHDLRASFITTSLANGRTEAWVMDRTGHTTSAMLNRYRRAARQIAELGLGDFVPLDEAIPEFRDQVGPDVGPGNGADEE